MVNNLRIPARPIMNRLVNSQIMNSPRIRPNFPPPRPPMIPGFPGMPRKIPVTNKENFFKSKKFLVLLAGVVLIFLIILMAVLLKENKNEGLISCNDNSDCSNYKVCTGGTCVSQNLVACSEGQTRECGLNDLGECSFGVERCADGQWSGSCELEVRPTIEICDSLDNDCDGNIDEENICGNGGGSSSGGGDDFSCQNGTTKVCGIDLGECVKGNETCINGNWSGSCYGGISPINEICDGKDNDCDLAIDEGNVCGSSQNNFSWGFTYNNIRTSFSMGENVYVAGYARNYSTPAPAGGFPGAVINLLRQGQIVGGPNYYADPSWWKIRWDDGLVGWSHGGYSWGSVFLEKISGGSSLSVGDSIKVKEGISGLGVRPIPSESFTALGSKSDGGGGVIIAGPDKDLLRSGYYIWWKVNFIGLGETWISEDKIGKANDMPSAVSTKFVGGKNVALTGQGDISLRMIPFSETIIIGTKNKDDIGFIVGSPLYLNSEWWWRVNFNENVSFFGEQVELLGWVKESSLFVPLAVNFTVGDRIRVKNATQNLAIRETPSLSATWYGGKNTGAMGNITGGPEFNEHYYWWKIRWDGGLEGWSVADYIEFYD